MRILKAGLVYFLLVFGTGFALAFIRIPFLVPVLGTRTAELMETPVMLAVIAGASRRLAKRHPELSRPARLVAGLLAFVCLAAAELTVGYVFGARLPGQYIASRDPVSGSVYLASLVVFAFAPALWNNRLRPDNSSKPPPFRGAAYFWRQAAQPVCRTRMKTVTILVAALATAQAFAQKLPPPSREVFKCDERGKVVYSDSPCLGGKRVDVEPTRGMSKNSGTERVGADVRKEQHNEQMAQALRPILAETAEQRAKRHRRSPLSAKAKVQCNQLDSEIPIAQEVERKSMKNDLPAAQIRLHQLRKQYVEFRC